MDPKKRNAAAVFAAVMLSVFSLCAPTGPEKTVENGEGDGPSSTSTGNAFGTMVDALGKPVAGAAVRLYAVDFQPHAGGGAVIDTVADTTGFFRFPKPAAGVYNVFGSKGDDGVLIDSFTVTDDTVSQDLAERVLRPVGAISGITHLEGQVDTNQTKMTLFLTGTGRTATVGMDGVFRFGRVPAGTYQLVAVPYYDYYSAKIMDVTVVSGSETNLDTLLFRVAPQGSTAVGNTPPVAVFSLSQDVGFITTVFSFDASGCYDAQHAAGDLLVRWDWNDDGWDTDWTAFKTNAHQYASTGTKTVKLEVLDPQGLSAVTSHTLTIANAVPSAAFSVSADTVAAGGSVTVDAAGCSDLEDDTSALAVRWDWEDDGTWDTGWNTDKTASHVFTAGGDVAIAVQVRDTEGSVARTVRSIYVIPNTAPVAVFTVHADTVWPGQVVAVDAAGVSDAEDPAGSLQVRWDWEDNGTWDTVWDSAKTARHAYTAVGAKRIRMVVRDSDGDTASAVRTVVVTALPAQLVAYWGFDELSGTVAYGLGDDAVDGTLLGGAARGTGISGNALLLDGYDDYVEIGCTPGIADGAPFTLSMWLYRDGNGVMQVIGDHTYTDNRITVREEGLIIVQNSNYALPGNFYGTAAGAVPLRTWTHIAYQSTGTVERLFVNGQVDTSRTVPDAGTTQGWNGTFYIGNYLHESQPGVIYMPYDGMIDEVKIFSSYLSEAEVQALYNEVN